MGKEEIAGNHYFLSCRKWFIPFKGFFFFFVTRNIHIGVCKWFEFGTVQSLKFCRSARDLSLYFWRQMICCRLVRKHPCLTYNDHFLKRESVKVYKDEKETPGT